MIKNRKYLPNKKNGGEPPKCEDERTLYVPVGCGKCMECKKQKKRGWQIRLTEEVNRDRTGQFVTLSFSDESLNELDKEVQRIRREELEDETVPDLQGYELENAIATLAVRRFLELWRAYNGKSVKHWLVTELGQNSTERIHIHGIIFTNDKQQIKENWKYGNVWIGNYVSERTVNYIVKYINKTDLLHKYYNPKILCSPGIGQGYVTESVKNKKRYNGEKTFELYKNRQGYKMAMPTYYRNKIYNEQERENLWLHRLDKEERWVCGTRISVKTEQGMLEYERFRDQKRRDNTQFGYGSDEVDKEQKKYEQRIRYIKKLTRIQKEWAKQNKPGGNPPDPPIPEEGMP